MRKFRFAGIPISSDVPFHLLPDGDAGDAPALLIVDAGVRPIDFSCWTKAEAVARPESEGAGARILRAGSDYLVRYDCGVDLVFRSTQATVEVHRHRSADQALIEHLLLDQMLPRVLGQLNHLMLHASAVRMGGRALCFIAPSGAGKSTLAAFFASRGHRVLADDVVRLVVDASGVVVHPGYPSLRLWTDSASLMDSRQILAESPMATNGSKRVFQLDGQFTGMGAHRLASLVLLAPNSSPTLADPVLRTLAPAAALMKLIGQSFALDAGEPIGTATRLSQMSRVCATARPLELEFPHDYSVGQRLVDCIEESMALASSAPDSTNQ